MCDIVLASYIVSSRYVEWIKCEYWKIVLYITKLILSTEISEKNEVILCIYLNNYNMYVFCFAKTNFMKSFRSVLWQIDRYILFMKINRLKKKFHNTSYCFEIPDVQTYLKHGISIYYSHVLISNEHFNTW